MNITINTTMNGTHCTQRSYHIVGTLYLSFMVLTFYGLLKIMVCLESNFFFIYGRNMTERVRLWQTI